MNLLPDTHLLLWATISPERLSEVATKLLEDPSNDLYFSAASMWEVSIKQGRGRADFNVDPRILYRRLIEIGFTEISVSSAHAFAVGALPPIHKDPFDRMLAAQAAAENILLLTGDPVLAKYPGPIWLFYLEHDDIKCHRALDRKSWIPGFAGHDEGRDGENSTDPIKKSFCFFFQKEVLSSLIGARNLAGHWRGVCWFGDE